MKPTALFSRLRGRARTGIVIEGVAFGLTALICFMLISFAIDRYLRLEEVYRISMLVVFVLSAWYLLQKHLFTPIAVDLTDEELALAMERGETDLQQSLISAVQFERTIEKGTVGNESTELMQNVVADVHNRVDALRDGAALDTGRVARFGATIVGCLAVVLTWGIIDSDSLVLWAKRNLLMSAEDWPRATQLSFAMASSNGKVAEGEDVTIVVDAKGVVPEQVWVHFEFEDGTVDKELMARMGDGAGADGAQFTKLLESVITGVTMHATGGDGLSEQLTLELVTKPRLGGMVITKTYPDYMQLEPEEAGASEGDIKVPLGTKLSFAMQATKPLRRAYLTFGKTLKQDFAIGADRMSFAGDLTPTESGVLTIDVTDDDGLGASKPPKIFLRVVPDRAPAVEYKTMGIGSMILYKALIPGTLKLRDDFGLTKVRAFLRITEDQAAGKEAKWEPLPKLEGLRQPDTQEGELEYVEKVVFDLLTRNDEKKGPDSKDNPIRPGMLLSLRFEADDNFGPAAAHIGKSETLTLRVVTQEKLMQDLHRRQTERRRELMRILEKERDARIQLEEKLNPTSNDPRAKQAQYQLQALARDQRALEKQVQHIASAYRQILDEYFNNRLLKPAQVLAQRQNIQLPLEKLAKEDFPNSAQEVADFARSGDEDARSIALSSYATIIKALETVISNMRQLESVAGILEEIRVIRNSEEQIKKEARKKLDELDKGKGKETPKKKGG